MTPEQQKELSQLIDKYSDGEGIHDTAIKGLRCLKMSDMNASIPVVYDPSICIIVQGAKNVFLEDELYRYQPSEYLVISVDLPVIGQVTDATPDKPYLCLQLNIDSHQLSELISQQPALNTYASTSRGLFVGKTTDTLVDCILRLTRLLDTPQDIAILAPIIIREFYYRLLNSEHGATIAQIAVPDSNMQRIAQVIEMLKTDFSKSLRIEDMANIAHMSPSSFYHHFKEVTAMSPLQYQKRLRLLEARRIMLTEIEGAAHAAYRVGYESASQFSREYARMFGTPPRRDIETMRARA